MNCARNYENMLNFVKVMPKILLVPFFRTRCRNVLNRERERERETYQPHGTTGNFWIQILIWIQESWMRLLIWIKESWILIRIWIVTKTTNQLVLGPCLTTPKKFIEIHLDFRSWSRLITPGSGSQSELPPKCNWLFLGPPSKEFDRNPFITCWDMLQNVTLCFNLLMVKNPEKWSTIHKRYLDWHHNLIDSSLDHSQLKFPAHCCVLCTVGRFRDVHEAFLVKTEARPSWGTTAPRDGLKTDRAGE